MAADREPDSPDRKSGQKSKPRFKERKVRDDEDDERPFRSRRTDDDEDDDRPTSRVGSRFRGSDRPPVLFLVGLVFGTVVLLGCCGVGGWGAYSVLVGKVLFGGWTLGGNDVEITGASRSPGFGMSGIPQVSWWAVGKRNVPVSSNMYFLVMKCGNQTHIQPYPSPTQGTTVNMTQTIPEFRNLSGPIEIWVERRSNPNSSGTRVSNKYTVP
jgi:hypothetical protein